MSSDYKEGKIKPPKMIAIRVIETRGEASLVEWKDRGGVHRGYVQNDSIDGDKALSDVLAYALPVGPDPAKMNIRKFTKQLRLRGVWTKADFRHKYRAVIKSLYEAMEV